jgi:hypothetical protein
MDVDCVKREFESILEFQNTKILEDYHQKYTTHLFAVYKKYMVKTKCCWTITIIHNGGRKRFKYELLE